jgi:hypothetical protein
VSECDCRELLLLAAGELDAASRRRVEAHVAACPRCADDLDALREALALAGRLPTPQPSAEAVDRARRAALRALARRRPAVARRPSLVVRLRYPLAAAAMLAAVVGWAVIKQTLVNEPADPAHIVVADSRTLIDNWDHWQNALTESTVLTDDLGTLQKDDPWALAEIRLAGGTHQRVSDDLQEIIEYIEWMDYDAADGS